jgi:hypothetical protein
MGVLLLWLLLRLAHLQQLQSTSTAAPLHSLPSPLQLQQHPQQHRQQQQARCHHLWQHLSQQPGQTQMTRPCQCARMLQVHVLRQLLCWQSQQSQVLTSWQLKHQQHPPHWLL